MKLTNYKNKREYITKKEVYQSSQNHVWCSTATEKEIGECFVKIVSYGEIEDKDSQIFLKKLTIKEADCIERTSRCTEKVPRLIDSWDDTKNGRYIIVMEKKEGQTLRDWMDKRPLEQVTEKDLFVRAQIVKQIAQILYDINSQIPSIVHRDLKPENIMITLKDKKWDISIIDFGCASFDFVRKVGTTSYQAPEQLLDITSVEISYKTDVFALGQIFYELLSKKAPQMGIDFVRQRNMPEWKKTPSLPEEITNLERGEKFQKLITSMTAFNMEDRPEYSTIIKKLNFERKKNYRSKK